VTVPSADEPGLQAAQSAETTDAAAMHGHAQFAQEKQLADGNQRARGNGAATAVLEEEAGCCMTFHGTSIS
jgi:hypothetical protein